MAKILIVEDDEVLCSLVSDFLIGERHNVEVVHDGGKADELLKLGAFDVIVLDWELPGKSGIDVLKEYRSRDGQTPVIMLTAKNSVNEKEFGLDIGADDYLTKPFAMKELAARIRAALRRPPGRLPDVLKNGNVELDASKHFLTKDGQEVRLQPMDFALLEFFMRNPDRIFSADVLLTRVWPSDSEASPDALRSAIKRIRKAIDNPNEDENSSIIRTVQRVGYTLRSS